MHAQDITFQEYEELNKRNKMGRTTTEENGKCHRFYDQKLLALVEPTDTDITACLYADPLRNYSALVDINNHLHKDNLKSIKFRESASAVNKLLNRLGYKHVKVTGKIDKNTFMKNFH